MFTSSVMLDLTIGAIVTVCAWLGAKRGLFRTLAELASYVAAYLISLVLSHQLASLAAELIRPLVESKLHEMVGDYFGGLREELPAFLRIEELLHAGVIDAGPFIERGLYNLGYMFCSVMVFLAALVILRMLIRALDLVTKLPVIHQFNTMGGLLAGGVKGILLVVLILLLARHTGLLVSPEAMADSHIVPLLQRFFPL